MLTVNVKHNHFDETIFSAVHVLACPEGVSIKRPAGEGEDYLAQNALVFVMNETGATVAKYDYRNDTPAKPGTRGIPA